jgi:general secretion pathway protein K
MARRLALLTNPRRDNSGFALIIVLWTLVLIAFIVAHLTADGRTELRIATNIIANATAQAAADGAIVQAIFNLSDPDPKGRWPVDGNVREVVVGNIPVRVRLEDEAWWINPSTASPPLVEALLRATGTDPEKARSLAIAISEWVGSVSVARPQNAILAEYQAAGLNYTPPGAPLETLDELGRVLTMTPAIVAVIRPHLTLFGPPEPSEMTRDPFVAAALAETSLAEPIPSASQPPPDVLTTRITATASGSSNASVTRSAIVRVGAALHDGYQVLARGNGVF